MFFDISLLLYCLIGVIVGTVVGVLPGIGAGTTLAILLPSVVFLPPIESIVMLSGIYYGAQYGGSTSSILMKTAGEVSSVPTILDGHKMALKGQAGPALSISAIGSFVAGITMTIALYFFAPLLGELSLSFGPLEYVLLCILGLSISIILSNNKDFIISLGLCIVGILLGLIGLDPMFGSPRYTLNFIDLHDGISIVSLSLGLYAFSELLKVEKVKNTDVERITKIYPSKSELLSSMYPICRGTITGGILGLLPGGSVLSSFAAHLIEKKFNKKIGTGIIQGVASPEAANNSGVQASFIPLLSFGIPTNSAMAIILSTLYIHGFVTGPRFFENNLFPVLIFSMILGNLLLLILNLPLIRIWVLFLSFNPVFISALVLIATLAGSFTSTNSVVEIYIMFFIGIVTYIINTFEIDIMPLLLGFLLGPMLEEQFRRSMMMFKGDITIYFYHPIFVLMLCVLSFYFIYRIKLNGYKLFNIFR